MATPYSPSSAEDDARITYFGLTDSRNQRMPFGIKREDRSRHTYVIGKTGMGKSTLLENMAIQDIQRGEGICFIDPHGGTADKLLEYVPEERIKDVLYFAPFDMQYPVSFNVLENVDADKRHLVVAGLMSTFEKIWVDAWSARMAYILQNTLASLLEFPGATLLGVNRMYIDKEYRKNVIAKITDPAVRSFWVDEYSKYTDRYAQEATPAIQNKIGQFASNALVRNVIGQEESAFNIRSLMDERKIFIVNLSKGRVGEGNANLLGSMLITKIYLAAMSRADASAGSMRSLPPFYLFVDEFQNFANKSFADILSEARKYKLALTIAHQYIEQMEEEVAAAVFGNVGTMITFRVGAYDAEVLEKEFSPTFVMEDLVNLGARQIYLKLMIDGVSSQPFSAVTMPPIENPEMSHKDRAIAFSRAQFSRPREEVEKNISEWVGKKYEDPEAEGTARLERRLVRESETAPARSDSPSRTGTQSPLSRDMPRPRDPVRAPTRTEPSRVIPPRPPAGQPRPAQRMAPRPPALEPRPIQREVSRPASVRQAEGLKDVLAHVGRESPLSQGQSLPAAPQPRQTPPAPVPFVPMQDDGKGITEDGKKQLRDLLASLSKTAQQSTQNVSVPRAAPTPPPASSEPHTVPLTALPSLSVEAGTTPAPQHMAHTPVEARHSAEVRKAPPSLPKGELRRLMHVDTPE